MAALLSTVVFPYYSSTPWWVVFMSILQAVVEQFSPSDFDDVLILLANFVACCLLTQIEKTRF